MSAFKVTPSTPVMCNSPWKCSSAPLLPTALASGATREAADAVQAIFGAKA